MTNDYAFEAGSCLLLKKLSRHFLSFKFEELLIILVVILSFLSLKQIVVAALMNLKVFHRFQAFLFYFLIAQY